MTFSFSRSARTTDSEILQIEKNIKRYVSLPKKFDLESSKPRYRFWEYSLVIELARRENLYTIMDVGPGSDIVYEVLCNFHQIKLEQYTLKEFMRMPISGNKYGIVTCFGELEHVSKMSRLFYKLGRHVKMKGLLVITSDDESPEKYKIKSLTQEDFIELSLISEKYGYELYELENSPIDYEESSKLFSIVMQRVGK